MSRLYESLASSSRLERQEIAYDVITALKNPSGSGEANKDLYDLCTEVIGSRGAEDTLADDRLPIWEFTSEASALLVRSMPRVSGFLQAIERARKIDFAIDAGCGSSAILAIGAATLHNAEVLAYEINDPAAGCAEEVISLFGLDDRVFVEKGDVLTADLPQADAGITETFARGVTGENGHKITAKLGTVSRQVIPAFARIRVTDVPFQSLDESSPSDWQLGSNIDLRQPTEYAEGRLFSTGAGSRRIRAYAGFFDESGCGVIDKLGANNLTDAIDLGTITVQSSGEPIDFRYALGSDLIERPAELKRA